MCPVEVRSKLTAEECEGTNGESMGQGEAFWVELLYGWRPGGEKNPEAGFPERWVTQV